MTCYGVVAPLLIVLSLLLAHVLGHGRMLVPPGRSSAWRVGFNTTKNYDDNGINCGGTENQWTKNHGKCGVCGDPWQGPRDNEAGGKYASGVIVRKYRRGRIFPVIIELTANHGAQNLPTGPPEQFINCADIAIYP